MNQHPQFETTRDIVAGINRLHGLRFSLRGRCAGGLQGGAWLLSDPAGTPAILKWWRNAGPSDVRQLAKIIDRIRNAGYPAPAPLAAGVTADGTTYFVQEFIPGVPSTPLTPRRAQLLIDILERQAGLDPDPHRDWSRHITASALEDHANSPRQIVRSLGARGQALVDQYSVLLARFDRIQMPTGDLVHGDFNSCNILLRDGKVSGVIDVEAIGSGTRANDYACLLREAYVEGYGPEVALLLRQAGEAVAGPGVLALCVAATAFEIVGFKLQHEPHRIDEVLARLRRLAGDLAWPL
ncbi:phosphotransferase [Actinopolymorpha alba]|uniref:phosphotransferase n=1 Tax=Actinopolymorpha alba TaxID=533267 RepID=UPI0003A8B52C|nr:phosphotransferase [Actinopolymorpha alba]